MNQEKCSNCSECIKMTHRTESEKKSITRRLSIIEGQIRGIKQMIEDDRYCGDVLIQLSAAEKAIESLENNVLENHIKTCVVKDIKEGKLDKVDEVMELIKKIR